MEAMCDRLTTFFFGTTYPVSLGMGCALRMIPLSQVACSSFGSVEYPILRRD